MRKLALRNAAKVAFGSLVMGCGGTVTDGGDAQATTDASTKKDSQTPVDSAVLDVVQPIDAIASDAPLSCTDAVDVDGGDPGPTVFQCCLGVVEAITGDGGFVVADAGEVTGDPSADNCCKAIIAHVDNDTADYTAADQTLPTCCNALGYPVGPACTPWGPPTPPAMPSEIA